MYMDVGNLRVSVVAQASDERRTIEEILRFIGVETCTPDEADALVVTGSVPSDVTPGRPVVYVGHSVPGDIDIAVHVGQLRYHELICALLEVRTLLHDEVIPASTSPTSPVLVGDTAPMVILRAMVQRASSSDASVLLFGEQGTGKEMTARIIHQGSDRADAPFVPVDCGAIPPELIESEVFGHAKGAFPGALTDKTGRMTLADDGVLFLDQVDALSYPMQVKLLRALQEGMFTPVGSNIQSPLRARVMCAASSDLESGVHDGKFREDLYYQINVFPLQLTPLRERAEDIPTLLSYLSADIERTQHITLRLSVDVVDAFKGYGWPGNIREFKNTLERLSILGLHDVITTKDLPQKFTRMGRPEVQQLRVEAGSVEEQQAPEEVRLPVNGLDLKDYLARLERSLIEQALDDTGSVVARAADRLHIRRTTLVEKMRKYGINRSAAAS